MENLSRKTLKRIIAGALAAAIVFTSIGFNNMSYAYADEPSTTDVSSVQTSGDKSETSDVATPIKEEQPVAETKPEDEVEKKEAEPTKDSTESDVKVEIESDEETDTIIASISSFIDIDSITVSKIGDIDSALPQSIIGVSTVPGVNLLYPEDLLKAKGYEYDEWYNAWHKNVDVEVAKWDLVNRINEDNAVKYVYRAVVDTDKYDLAEDLKLPTIIVYLSDTFISDNYCKQCLNHLTDEGICLACGKPEDECTCEEVDIDPENSKQMTAWLQKYAPNLIELRLKYDDDFFEGLKPNTKEYALLVRDLVDGNLLSEYFESMKISDALDELDKYNLTFETADFEGSPILKLSDEEIEELAKYDITFNDVSDYFFAYMGFEGVESEYFDSYEDGTDDELLVLLNKLSVKYFEKEKAEAKKDIVKEQNTKFVIPSEPTSITEETIVKDTTKTVSLVDFGKKLVSKIADSLFINASAADTSGGCSGPGWYDPGKAAFEGTGSGSSTVVPPEAYKNASRGEYIGNGFNTYVKRLDGQLAFCITHNKPFHGGRYQYVTTINNSPLYGILSWAQSNDPHNVNEIAVYLPSQLAAWTLQGQFSQAQAKSIMGNFSEPLRTQALSTYDAYMMNLIGSGPIHIYKPADGSDQQLLIAIGEAPIQETGNVEQPYINFETGSVSRSEDTSYSSDLTKVSVITNEKLSDIKYEVTELLGSNPKDSPNVDEGSTVNVTTDSNGHASVSFSHSASWEASWVSLDVAGIEAWISSGQASDVFIDLYAAMKSAYDEMLASGAYGSADEAQGYVDDMAERFLAIEYKYKWDELDNYTRPASSTDQNGRSLNNIDLPKQGYRKNIRSNEGNSNIYANVSSSDYTSPSIITSDNVSNGDNGHVDMSNQPYRAQLFINKTDLETNNQILYDTKFDIYENNNGSWIQSNYEVVRITDAIASQMGWGNVAVGMYTVHYIGSGFGGRNDADEYDHNVLAYGTLYYTQANQGKFKIVETKAPAYDSAKTGYINNFLKRPYTRVGNDLATRFDLSGNTDKTYPTPKQLANDIASEKTEHLFQICIDSDQYETFMLTDTGISKTAIYSGDYYFRNNGYDSTTHYYVGATEGDTNGAEKLYYTGLYKDTQLNYNTFVPGGENSDSSNKNTFDIARTLNNRHGYNDTEFVAVSGPQTGREYAFIDERVKGFIRLTKFDIDANRYVDGDLNKDYRDGTDHADADLDGAIYSLYVDNSSESYNSVQISNGGITHPDGRKVNTAGAADSAKYYNDNGLAILREQQVFVDTDNDGFCDTWKTQDVTLKNGVKVASAVIKNGELEFDGLYPGNYYIVEEVRAVEKVYGFDENDNEVSDENWLSFAPGYLADTYKTANGYALNKYKYQIQYNGEADYVIKDTSKVSYDTAIKGKVRIVKVNSAETVGSTTNNLDKESGAGFTVYLVSELKKIKNHYILPIWSEQVGHSMVESGELVKLYDDQKQFVGYKLADPQAFGLEGELRHTNRFVYVPGYGYYQMDQILNAYMNEIYSNEVPKWGQFANESQAIARVYEKDPAVIALANADYKILPNNHAGPAGTFSEWWGKSGIGEGYESSQLVKSKYAYDTNSRTTAQTGNEYVLSELFTNTNGQIKIPQLAWGTYIIVNTTVPVNKGVADPIFVTISDSTDDNSVTTAEPPYNLPLKPYNGTKYRVRIVKRDGQSGQNVLLANTKFRIWDYQAQKYLRLTVTGSAGIAASSCIFETDDSGFINYDALSMLEVGKYRIEEVEGPEGYWNAYWDYGNPSGNDGKANKPFTDKLGYVHYVVDAKQGHEFTRDPNGNVTTSDADNVNQANMRAKHFGCVDFEVTTERKWVSAALVSDILTTDNNEDILYIGESYSNQETLGMLTIMKTGEVLVGYDKTDGIEYRDEYETVSDEADNQDKTYKKRSQFDENVEKFDIGTDRDSSQNGLGASYKSDLYTNPLVEASYDYDDDTYDFVYEERPLANAVFQVIAAEDIYTQDRQLNLDNTRSTWFKKGDVVATVITAREGEEMDEVPDYVNGGVLHSTSTVNGQEFTQTYTTDEFQTTGRIDNKWIESRMSALDIAIFGVPEFKDEIIYPNSFVNEKGEKQVVVRVLKDGTLGQVSLLLPLGKYTVKEIEAPYGYVLPEYAEFDKDKTDKSIDVEFTWKDQIKEVVFNTNNESVANTKAKIDSFMDRNLAWWHGGINNYKALVEEEEIGVSKDQVLRDIARQVAADKRGTFTDGFIHKNAPKIIGDAEVQHYTDEQGFINFYNERIKPYADKEKSKKYLSVGIYKVDMEDNSKTLAGAKFGLYTKDDIYSVDGNLLVPANTRLAVATTDKDGFAEFEVDIPYQSLHFGKTTTDDKELYHKNTSFVDLSIDGNTSVNSGMYYIKELTPPEGYLFNDTVVTNTIDGKVDLTFDIKLLDDKDHDKVLLYPVYAEQPNKQTEVDVSKRDIVNEKEIAGAELEVYEVFGPEGGRVVYTPEGGVDWTKCTLGEKLDSWTSVADKTHVIRGLQLSNREFARLNNTDIREHVYLLREVKPAKGYVTATDIVFEVVQNYDVVGDGKVSWDEENNTVWVLNETTIDYIDGVIKAQPYYTDHDGNDKYNYNHDYYEYTNDKGHSTVLVSDGVEKDVKVGAQPGNPIANWVLVNGTLVIDIENDATVESIKKAFTAKRIIEALNMRSPAAADGYVKPLSATDVEKIYFVKNDAISEEVLTAAKNNLLKVSNGTAIRPDVPVAGSDTLDGIHPNVPVRPDAPISVNVAFTEDMIVDELPANVASWLDADKLAQENPELVIVQRFKWMSCPESYSDFQDEKTSEYGEAQFGRTSERSIERTIVMEDERTKLFISKADITNDKEIVGATIEIIDSKGEVVETWVSDGTDHYVELLPIGEYTLVEKQAPNEDGYVKTAEIKFVIEDDGHINTVYMPDNYTRLKITKTDVVTGENVIGAELELIYVGENAITYNGTEYSNGDVITSWTTTKEDKYIDRLPTGTYKLVETLAPTETGYVQAHEIIFELKDEDVVTKVDMDDDFTVTEISKTDLVTGEDVPGAHLELYRIKEVVEQEATVGPDGEEIPAITKDERSLVVSWTTGDKDSIKVENDVKFIKPEITSDGKIVIEYLPIGKYVLVETLPADGYVSANEVEFEVVDKLYHYDENEKLVKDNDGNVIPNEAEIIKAEMKDDFTDARFSKFDSVSKEEIEGASLEIYKIKVDEEGNIVYTDLLDSKGEKVLDAEGKPVQTVIKVDADTTTEKLDPVYSWISGCDGKDEQGKIKSHVIERIPVGKYVLVEAAAPDGYLVAEETVFEVNDKFYHYLDQKGTKVNEVDGKILPNENEVVKVSMEDKRGLLISKQNIVTGEEVKGAVLKIYKYQVPTTDEAGNKVPHDYSKDTPVEEWTSGNKPHGIGLEKFEYGDIYVLQETYVPDGYFQANEILFKLVEKEGTNLPEVQVQDTATDKFVPVSTRMIVMKDDVTEILVKKLRDDEKDTYVVGAQLGIYAVNKKLLGIKSIDWDNPLAVFTTNGTVTQIVALPVGTYVLHEISVPKDVPDGFKSWELAKDIEFEVTDATRSASPLEIKMYDGLVKADVETTPTPTPTATPTPTPTPEVITAEKVQTSDNNVIIPFVLAAMALFVAGWGSVSLLRKKEEDTIEPDDNNSNENENKNE